MNARAARRGPAGKVLVLGSGTGAFLSAIRSLGRNGLEVHATWESPDAPALHSKYVHRFHAIEPYDSEGRVWVGRLAGLMRGERFDVVIPTDEVTVRALGDHRAELERWGQLGAPSVDADRSLSDQARALGLARSLGIRVAESREIRELEQGDALEAELGFPLELRHSRSDDPADQGVAWLPQVASEPATLHRLLERMLKDGPLMVQQRIGGPLVGIGLLLDEGRPLMAVQYEHVHEPLHEARGSYTKCVPLVPELVESAVRLMRAVSFTGLATVEFRADPVAGAWVLMDASASLQASLPSALAAGTDFPMGLYRLAAEGAPPEPNTYRTAVHSRHLSGDMLWFLFKLRSDRNAAAAARRLLPAVLGEFARNVLLRREHFDSFAMDDPAPFMVETGRTLGMWVKLVQRRARRRLAGSGVLRRRLARDARHAVRDADRALFVCLGNICRSPFAEYRARDLGIFPEVASAGHDALEGTRSPRSATEAANDWDVDLSPHRSRRLLETEVRTADVIFVFDEDNEQRLIERFPSARDRVHYIGALQPRASLFVDDPFYGDLDDFRRSYGAIDAALSEMARLRGIDQEIERP